MTKQAKPWFTIIISMQKTKSREPLEQLRLKIHMENSPKSGELLMSGLHVITFRSHRQYSFIVVCVIFAFILFVCESSSIRCLSMRRERGIRAQQPFSRVGEAQKIGVLLDISSMVRASNSTPATEVVTILCCLFAECLQNGSCRGGFAECFKNGR